MMDPLPVLLSGAALLITSHRSATAPGTTTAGPAGPIGPQGIPGMAGPIGPIGPAGQSLSLGRNGNLNSFLPVLIGSDSGGVGTYVTQKGTWSRIGDVVNVWTSLSWSAHNGSGSLLIGELPFASIDSHEVAGIGVMMSNFAFPNSQITGYIYPGTSRVMLFGQGPNQPVLPFAIPNSGRLWCSFSYPTEPTTI